MPDRKRVKAGGANQPTTFSLRLVFWTVPSSSADMVWSTESPESGTVDLEILAVSSPRGTKMEVQAVFPKTPLPQMNSSSKASFLRALRTKADEVAGQPVTGISRDIIDWEGTETDLGYV